MRRTIYRRLAACSALLLLPALAPAQEPASLLARIKAVGKEGAGNVEAAAAWKELVRQGARIR